MDRFAHLAGGARAFQMCPSIPFARCILGKMLGMPMTQWSAIGGLSNASWSILENGHHRKGWVLVEHNAGSLPEPIYGEESGA